MIISLFPLPGTVTKRRPPAEKSILSKFGRIVAERCRSDVCVCMPACIFLRVRVYININMRAPVCFCIYSVCIPYLCLTTDVALLT